MGLKHVGSTSGGHSTQQHSWRTNSGSLLPPKVSLMINSSEWLGLQCAKDSIKSFTSFISLNPNKNPSQVCWEPHLVGKKGKQVPSPPQTGCSQEALISAQFSWPSGHRPFHEPRHYTVKSLMQFGEQVSIEPSLKFHLSQLSESILWNCDEITEDDYLYKEKQWFVL